MINFLRPPAKRQQDIKLNIVNAIELKPDSSYILVVDGDTIDRKDVNIMLKDLNKAGIKNVVSFMLSGNPDEAIQLVTKRSASKPKRDSQGHFA